MAGVVNQLVHSAQSRQIALLAEIGPAARICQARWARLSTLERANYFLPVTLFGGVCLFDCLKTYEGSLEGGSVATTLAEEIQFD